MNLWDVRMFEYWCYYSNILEIVALKIYFFCVRAHLCLGFLKVCAAFSFFLHEQLTWIKCERVRRNNRTLRLKLCTHQHQKLSRHDRDCTSIFTRSPKLTHNQCRHNKNMHIGHKIAKLTHSSKKYTSHIWQGMIYFCSSCKSPCTNSHKRTILYQSTSQ